MTPTLTPTDAAGQGTGDSALDSAFDALANPGSTADAGAVSGEQEGEQEQAAEPDDTLAGTEEVQPGQEAGQQPEQQEQPEEGVTPEGKGYRVAKERFENLRASEKAVDALIKMGVPTIQHVQALQAASTGFRELQHDLALARPESTAKVLDFLSGSNVQDPAIQASFKAGFVQLAQQIPDRLAQLDPAAYKAMQAKFLGSDGLREGNPEAFGKLEQSIVRAKVDSLYQKALETGQPKDFQDAQWADHMLTGRYYQNLNEVPRADPQAQRLKELETREKAIRDQQATVEQQQQTAREQTWSQISDNITKSEDTGLQQIVNEVLGKAAKANPQVYDEQVVASLGKAILAEVREELNQDWTFKNDRRIDLSELEQAAHARMKANQRLDDLRPQIDNLRNALLHRASPLIRAAAARYVSAKGKQAVAQNQQQTTRLQASQQKRGAAGGGTQTTRKVTTDGMSMEQKIDAWTAGLK